MCSGAVERDGADLHHDLCGGWIDVRSETRHPSLPRACAIRGLLHARPRTQSLFGALFHRVRMTAERPVYFHQSSVSVRVNINVSGGVGVVLWTGSEGRPPPNDPRPPGFGALAEQ